MTEWCKDESSPSCEFSNLYNMYQQKVGALHNEDSSGLSLAASDFNHMELPLLQSGAWSRVLFGSADGLDTAVQVITLRIALEKSLVTHANFLRSKEHFYFNTFAALAVPRMIASFSAYSQTLRRLIVLKEFQCNKPKNAGCQELNKETDVLRAQILAGLNAQKFSGLNNMNENNSSDGLLKAKRVNHIVQLLAQLKKSVSLQDLILSIKGTEHPIIKELKANLDEISSGLATSDDTTSTNMLAAIVILSEIQEVQEFKPAQQASLTKTYLTTQTSEEFAVLQSAILSVLKEQQVIQ